MAQERTLLEYITPNPNVFSSRIFIPQVEENNLDLKPILVNMIQNSLQFGGTPSDDPNSHVRKFLRLTDTIKFNGSITTWDQLARQFLTQYFPLALSSKMMEHIATFPQYKQESLCENAFKTFFESAHTMAIKCTNWRPQVEIYRIMGDLASNIHQWASQDRQVVKKKETHAGMYHVDQQTMLSSQIEAINKKLEELMLA
ncbi:Retrotransposon gag domain [Sesbania bispinosa]|nr:Retrotransposon gag domain [Sesbania bispinosa]